MRTQDDGTPSSVGRTLRRATLLAAASAVALVTLLEPGMSVSAWGESRLGGDIFARLQPVSDQVLGEERGKFRMGDSDINFGVAAEIRTFVNGQLASVSTLTDPAKGTVTFNQVITPVQNLTVTQVNTTSLVQNALNNGSKTGSADPPVTAGVMVTGPGGKSLVTTTFSPTGIQNLVVNDAAGRSLRNDVNLRIVLGNVASVMRQAQFARLVANVNGLSALALRRH